MKSNNIDIFLFKEELLNIFLELTPQLKNNKLNFVKAKYGYGDRQNWDDIPVHKSIDEIAELMLI